MLLNLAAIPVETHKRTHTNSARSADERTRSARAYCDLRVVLLNKLSSVNGVVLPLVFEPIRRKFLRYFSCGVC